MTIPTVNQAESSESQCPEYAEAFLSTATFNPVDQGVAMFRYLLATEGNVSPYLNITIVNNSNNNETIESFSAMLPTNADDVNNNVWQEGVMLFSSAYEFRVSQQTIVDRCNYHSRYSVTTMYISYVIMAM